MYGLVNKAVEDLVVSQFGADKWDAIKRKADLSMESFVAMNPYPDEITYKLVGAASEVLGLAPEQVLDAFGQWWMTWTAKEGYGEMLATAGTTFVEFLQNLDNMHARIGLSFPHLRPPSFSCTDVTERSLRLHHYTFRPGLAPFVMGLI